MLESIARLADPIGAIIGFVLTIMVFSYLIGDNVLFRLAVSIFVGVASGYAAVLILYNVIWNQVLIPLYEVFASGKTTSLLTYAIHIAPAIILSIWMVTKISPRLSRASTPVLAFLTGIGAATVLAGAVRGTILPQVEASMNILNIQAARPGMNDLVGWFVNGVVILAGTITTMVYFHFGIKRQEEGVPAQRPVVMEYLSIAGQGFIVVTLGVLFAGVYLAALSALLNRIQFIWDILNRFF